MLVLSVQSQHPTPQLLCQPCCCCTTGDFSREPLVSASTGTYPDHVFDYPPGDNRVLLDQLRQVVQPSSYGRNALLNPTGREGPGQTPLPSAAGFHAHRTQSRLKGRGNTPPPPQLSGAPADPQTLGHPQGLRNTQGTRGHPWDTPAPTSGAPTAPQGHPGGAQAPGMCWTRGPEMAPSRIPSCPLPGATPSPTQSTTYRDSPREEPEAGPRPRAAAPPQAPNPPHPPRRWRSPIARVTKATWMSKDSQLKA